MFRYNGGEYGNYDASFELLFSGVAYVTHTELSMFWVATYFIVPMYITDEVWRYQINEDCLHAMPILYFLSRKHLTLCKRLKSDCEC